LRQEEQEMQEVAQVQRGPYVSSRSRQILKNRQERTNSREEALADATNKFHN